MEKGMVEFSSNPSVGLPSRGRTRRLSLDVISPWKLLSSSVPGTHSKRTPNILNLSASVSHLGTSQNDLFGSRRSSHGDVSIPPLPFPISGPSAGSKWAKRRASQADIMMRASQVDKLQALHKKDKKTTAGQALLKGKKAQSKQSLGKESYLLVELNDEEKIVLTCKDEQHMKSVLTAALMDRRVRSYRMVVASTRAVFKLDHGISRRVRSCEDLLDSVEAGDGVTWASDTDPRLIIAREFLEEEKHYCDNLQSLFDVYAEPLRKFSPLSKEEHEVMFMPIEPLFSLSASLVTKLESVLYCWETGSRRIGNLFSSKFWNYYKEYYSEYIEAKRLVFDKFANDVSFRDFCDLRCNQGRLSLEALLTLPVS